MLSIDGSATGAVNTAKTSCTVSLTTTSANDVIGIFVINTGLTTSAPTVTSVTASGGTGSGSVSTFTQRGTNTGAIFTTQSGRISFLYATASSALTGVTITANLSSASDTISVIAFAISGANTSTPFDPNLASAITAQNISGSGSKVQTTGLTTTNANDMIVSAAAIFQNVSSSMPAPGVGYTDIATVANVGTAIYSPADSEQQVVSVTQSSVAVQWGTGGAFDSAAWWMTIADAIVAASAPTVIVGSTFFMLGVG